MAKLDDMMSAMGLDLDAILANSFKNFHAKGVDYICLLRTPELTRKLYLFNGDVTKFPEVVHPHDHRYPFRTRVLGGALQDTEFRRDLKGRVFNEFMWQTPLNGGSGFSFCRETMLSAISVLDYRPGHIYRMEHSAIHTIKVLANETALLQTQYADVVPLDQATRMFSTDKEPPTLSGLYEKFTPDEIAERLGWVGFAAGCQAEGG